MGNVKPIFRYLLFGLLITLSMDGLSLLNNNLLRMSVIFPYLFVCLYLLVRQKFFLFSYQYFIFGSLTYIQILILVSAIINPNTKTVNYVFGYSITLLYGLLILIFIINLPNILSRSNTYDIVAKAFYIISSIIIIEFLLKYFGLMTQPFSFGLDRHHYSEALDSVFGNLFYRSYGLSLEPTYAAFYLNSIVFFLKSLRSVKYIEVIVFFIAIFCTLSSVGILVALLQFHRTRIFLVFAAAILILTDSGLDSTVVLWKLINFVETERFRALTTGFELVLISPLFGLGPGFISANELVILALPLYLGSELGLFVSVVIVALIIAPLFQNRSHLTVFGSLSLLIYSFTFPSLFAPGFWLWLGALYSVMRRK